MTRWAFVFILIASSVVLAQDLIPVTEENEYRCKADTLHYYDAYETRRMAAPYSELSTINTRMNECVWLFYQLVIRRNGQTDQSLDELIAKGDAIQVTYQADMNSRMMLYLMSIGKYDDFLKQDAAGHQPSQKGTGTEEAK